MTILYLAASCREIARRSSEVSQHLSLSVLPQRGTVWRPRSRQVQRTVSTGVFLSYRKRRALLGRKYVRSVCDIKKIKTYFHTPGLLETEDVDPSLPSGLDHRTDPPEKSRDLEIKLFWKIKS